MSSRAALMVLMMSAIFLVAPSPGYTAGCSGGLPPNPEQFCVSYSGYSVFREVQQQYPGDPVQQQIRYDMGFPLRRASNNCDNFDWVSCVPTDELIDQCYAALTNPTGISSNVPTVSIVECNRLIECSQVPAP